MSEYYTLHVSRAENVKWKPRIGIIHSQNPCLYVEIGLSDVVQKTNTIKNNVAPSWEETLPLACPASSACVSILLKHKSKSKLDFRNKTVGCVKIELAKLLDDCKNGEIGLDVFPVDNCRNQQAVAKVFLRLDASNAVSNAELALRNLVKDDSPSTTCPAEIVGKVDSLAKEGMAAIQRDLTQAAVDPGYQAFVKAVRAINAFVTAMDNIAEINPFFKLAWYATSAVYKIIQNQINADQKFKELVKTLVTIFSFVEDVDHLGDIPRSFENAISELLGLITECCLLMRRHARHCFASRSLNEGDKANIDELSSKLISLKANLVDEFTKHTLKIANDIKNQVEVLKLLQGLGTSLNDDADASKRSGCFEDTQAGIRNDIKEWVSSGSEQNIFWLRGAAGSGKSTIATTIAKEFRSSYLGAYLLFERGKSDPSRVFRTIACRLANSKPALASHILAACSNKDIASLSEEENFETLFKDVLCSADDVAGPILIILEGLDECGSPMDRRKLLEWLEHDFSELPSKFRFLITSRPEDDIVQSLSKSYVREAETVHGSEDNGRDTSTHPKPPKSHILEAKLDHSSDSSRQDVKAYLSHAMRKVVRGRMPKDWDWEAILKTLGEAADGLFIWASTLVKFISMQTCQFQRLRELADNPKSHTPEGLYAEVFQKSINWSDDSVSSICPKIFALILFSKEPLTNVDIDGILGLDEDETDTILSQLTSVIAYEREKPIRLHHTSLSDYLTSPGCRGEKWFVDADIQKEMITRSCFNVMKSLLRFNICRLKSSFVRNDAVPGLDERIKQYIPQHLIYACRFWAQHLQEVPFSDGLLERLTIFAHKHLLSWFEVLSLTGNFYYQVGQALQNSVDWIEIGKNKPVLSAFLTEAIRLASTFAVPIAESTPHIYVSMLSLVEKDSDVAAHYMQKISSLSRVVVERIGIKQTLAMLKVFKGHTSYITSVGFSPDGKRVVSGSLDNTVLVWDVESGKVVAGPFKHASVVTSVDFSPDGKCVVSGSWNKTIRVWDVESGKVVAGPFKRHTSDVTSVAFSPDGKRVVSGSWDKTVLVWDVESGRVVAGPFKEHTSSITSVGFSPDGKRVVSGSWDKTVLVWDVESGRVAAGPFEGHTSSITSVGFSSDSKRVISGSHDKTVLVWDVESCKVIAGPFIHTSCVRSVEFSPDGKRVVSGSDDKTVRVWDVESGKVVAGPFEGHTDCVTSVRFSPDGKRVVSGSDDKTVLVWDVESGKVVAGSFKGHTKDVTSVGLSPDGKRVVSGSGDMSILVWDVESGTVVAGPFEGHTDWVTSVRFSPDGKLVVSGSDDKTVRVWDVESGKVVAGPFKGHADRVVSVGFSPDGKCVVSSSYDKTILVWDVENGESVSGSLHGLANLATSDRVVAFSQDGKRVVSAFPGDIIKVSKVKYPDDLSNSLGKFSDWTEDSWIYGKRGELLLWIPPDIRPTLWLPVDIAVFNCQFSTKLSFSNYNLDGKWCNDSD